MVDPDDETDWVPRAARVLDRVGLVGLLPLCVIGSLYSRSSTSTGGRAISELRKCFL